MNELDLLLIRQREHQEVVAELKKQLAMAKGLWVQAKQQDGAIESLREQRSVHTHQLEAQGHDYLTITAEMARIRAEVRGDK